MFALTIGYRSRLKDLLTGVNLRIGCLSRVVRSTSVLRVRRRIAGSRCRRVVIRSPRRVSLSVAVEFELKCARISPKMSRVPVRPSLVTCPRLCNDNVRVQSPVMLSSNASLMAVRLNLSVPSVNRVSLCEVCRLF